MVIAAVVLLIAVVASVGVIGYRRFEQRKQEREQALEALETKATPSSTADATADLVDPDYRFTLKWPGAGFKILHPAEARRLSPNALGAVMGEPGCLLMVSAEHVPGGELEAVARSLLDAAPAQDKKEEAFARTTLQSFPALRYAYRGKLQETSYSFVSTVVERDGWFLQFATWRPAQQQPCSKDLLSFVSLTPGVVAGRPLETVAKEELTSTHRVSDGVFESAVHRLRLKVPSGATLMTRAETYETDPDAAAIVFEGSKTVVLSAQPRHGRDAAAVSKGLVKAHADLLAVPHPTAVAHTSRHGGQTLELYELLGPAPYQTLCGGFAHGSDVIFVRVAFPPALRAPTLALLERVLEQLTLLDDAQTIELAARLPKIDPHRSVRATRALRGGRYTDFSHGIELTLPREPSVPSLDLQLRAPGWTSNLTLKRPTPDVTTVVAIRRASGELAAEQKELALALLGVGPDDIQPEPALSSQTGATARFRYQLLSGPAGRIEVSTRVSGEARAHVATWGSRAAVESAATGTSSLLESITFASAGLAEEEWKSNQLRHRRFGFELSLPPGDWKKSVSPLGAAATAIGVGYSLDRAKDSVGVFALHVDSGGMDQDFLLGLMEQAIASKVSGNLGAPRQVDGQLGQLRGRSVTWSDQLSAAIAHEGDTYYCVFVERAKGSTLDPAEVFKGFRLLD